MQKAARCFKMRGMETSSDKLAKAFKSCKRGCRPSSGRLSRWRAIGLFPVDEVTKRKHVHVIDVSTFDMSKWVVCKFFRGRNYDLVHLGRIPIVSVSDVSVSQCVCGGEGQVDRLPVRRNWQGAAEDHIFRGQRFSYEHPRCQVTLLGLSRSRRNPKETPLGQVSWQN